MKKIKNKAKYQRHQNKKALKRKTVAEQNARSAGYKARLRQKRDKEIREFLQFAEFMDSVKQQQMSGEEFAPNLDDHSKE